MSSLEKGRIYMGGTIDQFQSLTGYTGRLVIFEKVYFGLNIRGIFCPVI